MSAPKGLCAPLAVGIDAVVFVCARLVHLSAASRSRRVADPGESTAVVAYDCDGVAWSLVPSAVATVSGPTANAVPKGPPVALAVALGPMPTATVPKLLVQPPPLPMPFADTQVACATAVELSAPVVNAAAPTNSAPASWARS